MYSVQFSSTGYTEILATINFSQDWTIIASRSDTVCYVICGLWTPTMLCLFFSNCGKSGEASWRMGLLSRGPTLPSFLFFSTLFVWSIIPKMEHAKFQEYEFMKTDEPTLIALKCWRRRLQRSVGSISWRQMLSLPQILA